MRGRGPLLGAFWEFTKRPCLFSGSMDVAEEQVQDFAARIAELQRPLDTQQARSVVLGARPWLGKHGSLICAMRTPRWMLTRIVAL